ncbi:MAG: glutathione S-transferase family protein, partial [Myxococcales bacterium]|nr:glutathione S-transferase family protein [Myxococcales bacterium]
MIKLWFAPRTRAVRIVWLLEELGLPYELERVSFEPTSTAFFRQQTPTGKIPVIEDDGVVMSESGAIIEYLLERHGAGRLAPAPGTPERARYLQWLHFAESTAYPPLGIVVWLVVYRGEAESQAELVADARARARSGFDFLEAEIGEGPWLLGEDFTAADVMMGFTLAAARLLAVIDDE